MVNTSTIVTLLRQQIPGYSPDQADLRFNDLGLDSFGFLQLLVAVERVAGAPLSDDAWAAIQTPAQLVAHLQRGEAVSPAPPSPTLRRRHTLNMPQMALGGLSESWLCKELGDAHWSMITAGLGAPSSALCDDEGARLYAAVTRLRFESTAPLRAYREDEPIALEGTLGRFGRGIFFSEIALQGAGKAVKASLMSTFTKRGEPTSNASLMKSQPKIPAGCPVPDLATLPDFGVGYRLQRASVPPPALFETTYDIVPYHDINGVGLLYFAAYPTISDVCELAFMERSRRWAFDASTISRDVFYFANADALDRLVYRVHAQRPLAGGVAIESSLSRASDGTLMAYIVTHKAVTNA